MEPHRTDPMFPSERDAKQAERNAAVQFCQSINMLQGYYWCRGKYRVKNKFWSMFPGVLRDTGQEIPGTDPAGNRGIPP